MDNTYCHTYTLGVIEKLESFGPISCFLGIQLANFCVFVSLAVLDQHSFQELQAV